MNDIPTTGLFGILTGLLCISAFFSGSETALMVLNRYRLKHLAEQGHKGAIKAQKLLETPDRLIGLILLGNNFVNIFASAIATIIALRLGGEPAIAAATGLLTLVVLIYAEVIPKTFAAMHPEKIAFPAAHIHDHLLKILYPVVYVVNWITKGHMRLLGISTGSSDDTALSREELRTVVNEAGAMIPQRHRKMLLGILDLENATVADIMVPRNEVEDFLENTHFTRILVYEGSIDNIVGSIHARRIMHLLMQGELTKEKLRESIKPPYYIPEGTTLNTLMFNFQRDRRRLGLVVDEYGEFEGLVSFANLVEEIVGEFTTDPTASIQDIQPQEDGSYVINGSVSIRELVKTLDWNLPQDGPKTLNGLILEYLESIPEPNTSLLLAGFPVEILQMEDNMVKVVRVSPGLKRS